VVTCYWLPAHRTRRCLELCVARPPVSAHWSNVCTVTVT